MTDKINFTYEKQLGYIFYEVVYFWILEYSSGFQRSLKTLGLSSACISEYVKMIHTPGTILWELTELNKLFTEAASVGVL